ncbi:unnamed protein product [Didymodactylos carnosus]|uniref:Uncharacterized protein n=1 Tax=Didymodactylos carnosus TaxID=1234261 RepID=A0A813PF20_9BILA|nr:unnamed protein product [Didymodactylos carnosus]CAF3531596.1 unnamed protein product [Didymodactylos carnosus]
MMVNSLESPTESVTSKTVAVTTKDFKDGRKSSLLSPTNEKKRTKKTKTTTTSSSSSSRTTKRKRRKDLSSTDNSTKPKSVTNRRISFTNSKQQSQKRPRSLSDESTSSRSCSSDSSCSSSSSDSSLNSSLSSSNSNLPTNSVPTIKMTKDNDNIGSTMQSTTDDIYDMEMKTNKNSTLTVLPPPSTTTILATTTIDANISNDKSRRSIAEEHIKTITSKTNTGKHDIIDGFAFLSFENNDDLLLAYEQHRQLLFTHNKHKINERNRITIGRKSSRKTEHSMMMMDELNRSMSMPCNPTIKIEDITQSLPNTPSMISALDDNKSFAGKNNQQQLNKFDDINDSFNNRALWLSTSKSCVDVNRQQHLIHNGTTQAFLSSPTKLLDNQYYLNMIKSESLDLKKNDIDQQKTKQNLLIKAFEFTADENSVLTNEKERAGMDENQKKSSLIDDCCQPSSHRDSICSNTATLSSITQNTTETPIHPESSHHYHRHHHHKSHKKHKSKHLNDNPQQIPKHSPIMAPSELNKERRTPSTNKPEQNLFDYSQFKQFPSFPPPPFGPSLPFDPLLYSRFYNPQHNFDPPIPPPPLFSQGLPMFRPYPKPDESSNSPTPNSVNLSFEKMLSSLYPSYMSAAAAAAAASNMPSSSNINMKMDSMSMYPQLWSRENLQRQLNSHYLATHHNQNSFQQQQADKLTQSKSDVSPAQFPSTSKAADPPPKTPTSTSSANFSPLPYHLPPLIFTEFHQHQHNHNHTHQHNLNLATKDESSHKSPSVTPNPPVTKDVSPKKSSSQTKTKFSVSEMFINDNQTNNNLTVKKPNELSSTNHAFLSVNKSSVKNNCSPATTIKQPSNGHWSTAHIHIAWMIYYQEQRIRDKFGLASSNKQHNPATNTLRPPFLPFDTQSPLFSSQNDMNTRGSFSPWITPSFKSLPPFLPHQEQSQLFRPPFVPVSNKLSSSANLTLPCPKPIITSSTTIKPKRDSEIKHQTKPVTNDVIPPRTTPLPTVQFDPHITNTTSLLERGSLSPHVPGRSVTTSAHLLSSPSLRLPQQQSFHTQNKDLLDERRKFNQEQLLAFPPSPFLSFLLPNSATSMSSQLPPFNRPTTSASNIDYKPSLSPYFSTSSSLFDPSAIGTRGPSFLPDRLEQERYRYLFEQQQQFRERELQMMVAAANHPLNAFHQSLSANDERMRLHERLYKPY